MIEQITYLWSMVYSYFSIKLSFVRFLQILSRRSRKFPASALDLKLLSYYQSFRGGRHFCSLHIKGNWKAVKRAIIQGK